MTPTRGSAFFIWPSGRWPGSYQKLLKLVGFRGDVDRGLDELQLAATHSRFNREEANVYLAMIDLKLFDASGDGGERLAALFHAHEESPLIGYIYGEYLHVTRQATEAERVYRAAAETYDDGAHFYIDYVDPLLGDVLFRQNRFEEAAFYITAAIWRNTKDPRSRPLRPYRWGSRWRCRSAAPRRCRITKR